MLYFYPTKRGGLGGLIVECAKCKSWRSMFGSTSSAGLRGFSCEGHRPWLGQAANERCDSPNTLFALQRGASNLYFPGVSSSILIPPFSSRASRVAADPNVRRAIEQASDREQAISVLATSKRVTAAELTAAYEELLNPEADQETPEETSFRRAEYEALQRERSEKDDSLVCHPRRIEEYGELIRTWFSGVTLVESLAETRALTGFHRIGPIGPAASLSNQPVGWLPGFRVQGEGIFIAFRHDRLSEFTKRWGDRSSAHLARATSWGRTHLELSPRLVLLHSFAHMMIKRLAFEAGYGASSIRERIYSSESDHAPMAGVLLYTAAGDADGTLGGLVSLGKPRVLDRIVALGMDDVRWCAADPICVDSPGQGPESLNLAACHVCALLPETSCELQNRILDRRIVHEFFGIARA